MLTEERFAKILSILESMGSVTVQQLMTELDASESTIRRDLNAYEREGEHVYLYGSDGYAYECGVGGEEACALVREPAALPI